MSENQSEQPATPVGPVQHPTLVGHVQHLQVEDEPQWAGDGVQDKSREF